MKRQVPKMTTDEEAEAFLEADLSELDFSQFKPVDFVFRGPEPASAGSPHAVRLAPGTPAPYSGIYREVGPRGGQPGECVAIDRGKPLPRASRGRNWTLVSLADQPDQK